MNTFTNIFLAGLLVTGVVGFDVAHTPKVEVMAQEVVVSSVASPTPTSTPQLIPTDIVGYINYKFGSDAPKAFLLLQGNGAGSCAENRYLDPNAKNDNTTWGGIGIDRGYWQINSVFHPVSDWCASDVVCSTDYAYRMFVNDGGHFSRWTCGKVYGI